MSNSKKHIAGEIDERIARAISRKGRSSMATPELLRGWQGDPGGDNSDPAFDFGVLSVGEKDDDTELYGEVKLAEGAGASIERIDADNALEIGLDARRGELLSLGDYETPVQLTSNDPGEDLIAVFRMMNSGIVYALSPNQIWRVDTDIGQLVAVPGATPLAGEEFTCVRVYQGWAFIGTRETNGVNLYIYRFDGTSLNADMTFAANGDYYEVTSMTVTAMGLYALIGDMNPAGQGWRVFRRMQAGTWTPIITWQAGEAAGELSGSNELILTVDQGAQSIVYSLNLGLNQTAPGTPVALPNANSLTFTGNGSLARYEREVLVADCANIWVITDAMPKTWSGAVDVDIAELFMLNGPYTVPASFIGVDSSEVAFGVEIAGLFVFGVRVTFLIDATPTYETFSYILGYDGGEIIELSSSPAPGTPYLRPVEVAPDGSIYLVGKDTASARYVWRMPADLVHSLTYSCRALAAR